MLDNILTPEQFQAIDFDLKHGTVTAALALQLVWNSHEALRAKSDTALEAVRVLLPLASYSARTAKRVTEEALANEAVMAARKMLEEKR